MQLQVAKTRVQCAWSCLFVMWTVMFFDARRHDGLSAQVRLGCKNMHSLQFSLKILLPTLILELFYSFCYVNQKQWSNTACRLQSNANLLCFSGFPHWHRLCEKTEMLQKKRTSDHGSKSSFNWHFYPTSSFYADSASVLVPTTELVIFLPGNYIGLVSTFGVMNGI